MPDVPTYDDLPADVMRGLISPRMSRRSMLQLGGASALAMALAACGVSSKKGATATGTSASAQAKQFWSDKKQLGTLDFANWPLYIDVSPKNKNDHPSLNLFTQQTGIKVKYSEVIQENASFFGKIQPELAAGQSTGYDLMVITNGTYLDKLRELGYLIALDQSRMGNVYSMAWQSGMTGIGYDPKRTGRVITSWADLTDPAFKGKVGMFGDTQDLPNSALLAVGVKPEDSTEDDWKKAADWLKKQRPDRKSTRLNS